MSSKKYNALIYLLSAIIVCFGLAGCTSKPKLPPLDKDAVILAFGDSLTFGTGAEPGQSYPAVLENIIGRRVINSGVPGEVSAEGLTRLPEVLEFNKPALMILCHGGNDQLRRQNIQQTADNIRAMIRIAREKNVAVVLIAVPAPGISLSPPSIYKNIARETSIPVDQKILSDILADNSLKSDLIHPNAEGYRRLAESIAALLRRNGAID